MHLPNLISDLALMLIVAGIITLIFKKIRQPLVLGYIVAGFLISPYFSFIPTVTDTAGIETWKEIGIIILMFCLGLEFNLHKLISVGGSAIITAMTEIIGMLLLGLGLGQLMGWSLMNSIFLGGVLSMSSTTIIIKAFEELNMRGKKFTELVFGTLVIEDIMGIFMMIILSTISVSHGVIGGTLALKIIILLFYLALWLILGIYLVPSFFRRAVVLMNEETLLVVSLGICLGMVLLADALGFSSALGAFLAGSLIAGTVHAERVEHLTKPVKDLFGSIFFISVGMLVDPAVLLEYIVPIILITLLTLVGKLFFSSLGMLISGQSLSVSLHCGFSLAQIGEFAFIIASLGLSLGVISDFLYPIVVAVSVITTFTTPFFIKAAPKATELMRRILPDRLISAIDRNTSEHRSEAEQDSEWQSYLRYYVSRTAIYAIIMAGIMISGIAALPFISDILDAPYDRIADLILILLGMSIFLRPLLGKRNKYFTNLWLKNRVNRLPLTALAILRYIIAGALMFMPFFYLFNLPLIVEIIAVAALIFLLSRSKKLSASYLRIEASFLANLNERNLHRDAQTGKNYSWLDETLLVAKFICKEETSCRGKDLISLGWGAYYDVNVIKIIRGGKHINIPAGKEQIQEGDIVYLLGEKMNLLNLRHGTQVEFIEMMTDQEITNDKGFVNLREFIKAQSRKNEEDQLFCYALEINQDTGLSGVSIRESNLKKELNCILLGLQRNNYLIVYPNIDMNILANDIVWLLGSKHMAQTLLNKELLQAR